MKDSTPLGTKLIVLALGILMVVPAVAIAAYGPPATAGGGSGATAAAAPSPGLANSTCIVPTATAPVAPADAALAADLKYMREEEKLAHDVYAVLSAKWGARVFSNIAVSEQRHTDAIATLLDRYGVADPADGKAAGVFENADLQKLYNDLVAKGSVSAAQAFKVGKLIEETDIADLDKRIARTSAADVLAVYKNLRAGSVNHLAAFNRQISGAVGSGVGQGAGMGAGAGAGRGAGRGGRGGGAGGGMGRQAGRAR
jgi:hypothetical protein